MKKEKRFKELVSRNGDNEYIYTPLSLCSDMLSSIDDFSDKKILVIRNIEFVYQLYSNNIDMKNVYFSTNNDHFKNSASALGISLNQITFLEYNTKEPNFGLDKNMKFDIIVANPPYKAGLHLKFLDKSLDLLKEDGELIFVHPSDWLVQKRFTSKYNFYKSLKDRIKGAHIKFIKNPWTDINIWTPLCITHIKNSNNVYYLTDNRLKESSINKITNLENISQFGECENLIHLVHKIFKFSEKDNFLKYLNKNKKKFFIHINEYSGRHDDESTKSCDNFTFYDGIQRKIYQKYNIVGGDMANNVFTDVQLNRKNKAKIYISFNTEIEAKNCLDFLTKSIFFKAYYAILKIDLRATPACKYIPWLDWKQEWTDEKLFSFFKVSEKEKGELYKIIDKITLINNK